MFRDHLASSLRSNTTHLVDVWLASVRQDPRIRSDERLTRVQLEDEVPALVAEIADALQSGEVPTATSAREGRAHVYTRYRQGYRARDLVRELSLLRTVILDYAAAISSGDEPPLAAAEYAEAARVVNVYLDEEMRYAITLYTESQPGA